MNTNTAVRTALAAGVYWGAIWGLYEATVGWLLHFLPRVPGTAGVILVPFAVYCLDRARRHGGARAVLVAAGVAAALKLTDFALPARSVQSIVNPALAILAQGLAFAAVQRWLGLARRAPSLRDGVRGALAFSVLWRGLFLLVAGIQARAWSTGMLRDGIHDDWTFLVRDTLTSSAAILAVLWLAGRRRPADRELRPTPAAVTVTGVVLLAAAAELAFGMLR